MAESAPLDSKEALKLELVNQIVADEDVVEVATAYLERLVQDKDPQVIRAIKKCILAQMDVYRDNKALEEEQRLFASLWAGPANLAAIKKYST